MAPSQIATNVNGHAIPTKNGINGSHNDEMHTNERSLEVDFKRFFGVAPCRINGTFSLHLAEESYLPKVNFPRADWAVIAAFNSFQAYQSGQLGKVRRFATIGTGSGTDMIAALETFPYLEFGAMTDLHQSVVNVAKQNVLRATGKSCRAVADAVYATAGDLLLPLKEHEGFDLIYENLPNIPLAATASLADGQSSSTYVGDRTADQVPAHVSEALLDLHYVCLHQARVYGLMKPWGAILSSMGGRVSVQSMIDMGDAAGYSGRIISLAWKIQSEPEAVIGGYAENQRKTSSQYFFYPTSALVKVFGDWAPAAAAMHWHRIEHELRPYRLDAETALKQHHAGVEIGHTVYVMASVLKGNT